MFEDVMQPTVMLPKLTDTTQTISFSDGDGVCSAEVVANNVVVSTNAGNHNHGSSKVKLKNLVDYNWEPKFYSGQLLAIHKSGQYLAYSIKAPNPLNPGTWSGMVRVVYNPEPGIDRRVLIKGMNGEVQDLAFAHIPNQVVLACIDEQGNFYIHEIEATENKLRCTLLAEVPEEPGLSASTHRVVWCPYIPDEDDESPDDEVAWLLLTTHANMGRMWNVRALALGSAGAGAAGAARAGEHEGGIAHAAFSPDGTALATAAHDGYVMFFQVYMNNESSPRCLHKWQPHGGKPLSCLFFLDNHKNYNTDVQFWKFAVTGAENNTTIKVWSCKSWSCLQTLTFTGGPGADASFGLKAQIDTSATYLLLSDFTSRSLYVLNMARDKHDTMAYCKNISEFLLPYPVLSFCILDAEEDREGRASSCDEPFGRAGGDTPSPRDLDLAQEASEEEGCGVRVRVRLYIVQPKGLQEGELAYVQLSPPAPPLPDALHGLSSLTLEDDVQDSNSSAISSSILQQQSQQLKNLLMRSQTQPGSLIGQRADSPPSTGPPLNLMTPDAFSSPGKREEEDPPLSETPDASPSMQHSTTSGGGTGEGGAGAAASAEPKPTSGGSSPSREVQQIMAHDAPFYKDEDEPGAGVSTSASAGASAGVSAGVSASTSAVTNGDALYQPDLFAEQAVLLNNTETSWPQIPVVETVKPSSDQSGEQSRNVSVQEERAPSAAAGVPAAAPQPHPQPHPQPQPQPLTAADVARIDALDRKLDKLTELVAAQSREMRALRADGAAAAAAGDPRELMERALQEHSQRTKAALNAALANGWERVVSTGEACGSRAAAAAGAGAARALEPLTAALRHELAAKLTATDHLLRENIEKLATSKTVMERLSTAIAKSLSEMVRESLRATLQEAVVPLLEKAHAQLFRQLNQAFQNGTKEFAANTEAAARAAAERGGAAGAAALRSALDRHTEVLTAHAHAQHAPPTHHQLAAVIKDVTHNVLEKELSWWREQARACAGSRAHSPQTPAAHDRQVQLAQIQALMGAGDVNGAFQLALSAADLALVVAACRSAEPARVFAPGALRHPVLLSLVQQLAADMQRDTVLKHRYLEEAIMSLDTSNPVTREHLPVVIRELQKQIIAFLNANPGHALTRQFKMLLMATESLVKTSV